VADAAAVAAAARAAIWNALASAPPEGLPSSPAEVCSRRGESWFIFFYLFLVLILHSSLFLFVFLFVSSSRSFCPPPFFFSVFFSVFFLPH
jgi:hypothetical protein